MKDLIHSLGMEENLENDVFTEFFCENSIKELKKKNGKKYEFIVKSGKSFKEALYNLFCLVWNTEEKPEQWRKTTIIQLYKGKVERNEF